MGSTVSMPYDWYQSYAHKHYLSIAESPSGRGVSAMSGPLDYYFGDGRDLYFQLIDLIKSSPWAQNLEMHLIEEDESELTRTLLFRNLPREIILYGRDDFIPDSLSGPMDLRTRMHRDRTRLKLEQVDWIENKIFRKTFWQVHEDPVSLEFWTELPGERVDNDVLKAEVETRLHAILKRTAKDENASVKVLPDAFPIGWPGKSTTVVMTGPLDDFIGYDELWDEWIDMLKYRENENVPGLKDVEFEGDDSPANLFTTFTTKRVIDKAFLGTEEDEEQTVVFRVNKIKGWIRVAEWGSHTTQAPKLTHFFFHKDPLRIEALSEEPGQRCVDMDFGSPGSYSQSVLDILIIGWAIRMAEANKGPSWTEGA